MATKSKRKSTKSETKPEAADAYEADRSPESGVPATTGPATLMAAADDPNAEPTALDPGGDIATDFRTEVVGREIVITRWGLAPASEQYANANPYGMFAVLGFRFASDTERKSRFTTTGATRIVESVHNAIVSGTKLPVSTTAVAFQARGGTGFRFLRPGETAR